MSRFETNAVYLAAAALAIGSALMLVSAARVGDPSPAWWPAMAKALLVTTLFQGGLVWMPSARGRWQWLAALLMVPSLLLFAGFAGQEVSRFARHFPVTPRIATVGFGGVAVYLVVLWRVASLSLRARTERRSGGA